MSTSTDTKSIVQTGIERRVLREGYGPGAWHGADLKAALADVTPALAFWRPAARRHCIAEIALHHAYCIRSVRSRISGRPADPFVLTGDDWFELADETALSWPSVLATVEAEQHQLEVAIDDIDTGLAISPLPGSERFDLALGITCHAIYHAGQIQLVKRLAAD